MFCENCGKEPGDGKFCQECGAPVNQETPSVKLPKFNLTKKTMGIIGGIAAGVVAIIVALVLILGNQTGAASAKDAAKEYFQALANVDAKTVVNLMPSFMVNQMCEEYDIDNPSRNALIKALKEEAEDDGADKTKIKIKSAKVLKEYDMEYFEDNDYIDDFQEYYDATDKEIDSIQDMAMVEITYTTGISSYTNTIRVTCLKISGRWYVMANL